MTLASLLETHARQTPDATALLCGDRALTYAELHASSDALAHWLLNEGLRPGDRIAIQWPNAIEVVQLFFAAFKAGLIAVPINLRLKPAEIAYVMQDAGAAICFAHPRLAEATRASGVRTLTELPVCDAPVAFANASMDPSTPALILYTSGSTGRPKGAVISQSALVATGEQCAQVVERFESGLKARGLLMTPLMHSSGLFVLLASFQRGESCVLLPAFDPGAVLDAIARYRCSTTLSLPAMMQFVLEEQARQPRDVSSLRVIFAGGDSVPVPLQERARQLLGCIMVEGLAQTETGPTISNPPVNPKPGSLGIISPGVEVSLVDFVTRRPVADDEPGELLVKGPAVCSGYWQNDEATRQAFEDGWFRTGDLVSRDADGFYWFRGRLKEIIIRGGSNISPQEVEEALYSHPDVLEVAVVGLPDPVWGEIVVAAVTPRPGRDVSESELRAHAGQTLADYKVPERVIITMELPKTATGKVHRKAVRDALTASGL